MLQLIYERQFLREVKKAKMSGKGIKKLQGIVELLVKGKPLPAKNRNHKLTGNFKDYWECHIEPDWLLIYKKTSTEIIIARTGSHSDLF